MSSDVVGYTAKEAEQGKFIIMGAQLERLADSGRDMKINGLVTGLTGVVYDSDDLWLDTASQVQVPSATGYTTYRYLNDGWYDDGTEEGAYKAGWCDVGGVLVSDSIAAAQGFWTKGVTGEFTLTFNK